MSFTHPLLILLHLGAFAFTLSLALTGFMIFAGLLDVPVARSSHKKTIPTAGGAGLVAGLGAGLLALTMFYPQLGNIRILGQLAALGFGVSFLGLLDDIYELNSKLKFLIIIILSSAAIYIIGPPPGLPFAMSELALPYWIGFVGAVLWLFVIINAVNFMDGANGLMGGAMMVNFVCLAVISFMVGASNTAILTSILAAALLGFLPYNARKNAYIFCGDIGSLLTGFMFGICSLLLIKETQGASLLYVGPLLILPFLVDILLTMLMRAKHKENLFVPHNTHLYQRLLGAGHPHLRVAILYILAAIFMGAVTIGGVYFGLHKSVFFLSLWVSVLSLIYFYMYKKLRA